MIKIVQLAFLPEEVIRKSHYKTLVSEKLGMAQDRITHLHLIKQSIDARRGHIIFQLNFELTIDEPAPTEKIFTIEYPNVRNKKEVIIIGAGPAGLFAALKLIELGLKPVILERGKDVGERKKDIALLSAKKILNPESNYCFGEGGAGTFSDGKLYTRSQKRGDVSKIFNIFHQHGASDDILTDSHPHIGTDKLPAIISGIRNMILNAEGEIHFNTKVTDFIIKDNIIKGVIINASDKVLSEAVILATGHSAKDIYQLLFEKHILLEPKAFAMGVRVEHPQELIDDIQYHGVKRGNVLPPAIYNLAVQSGNRGVYSFCMCPGGYIVPASTNEGESVVNGMSPSSRNSPFANAGIVVEIRPEDTIEFQNKGPLAGLYYQEKLERLAYQQGNNSISAPAQRLTDFVNSKTSKDLPACSYHPGTTISDCHRWLPENIRSPLQHSFKLFEKKMRGYLTHEAIIVGVESRTSSPVKIPRNRDNYQHVQIKGLFPCGEGSGYSGGIVSSAMDGENCAFKAGEYLS